MAQSHLRQNARVQSLQTKKAHTILKEHRLAFLSFIMKEDYNKYNAFATDALYNFHVERIFKEIHHAQST